jgi:hypothetical protein
LRVPDQQSDVYQRTLRSPQQAITLSMEVIHNLLICLLRKRIPLEFTSEAHRIEWTRDLDG